MNLSSFWAWKFISSQEDMKIKKNAFSTLILEFFCRYKFSCNILKNSKNPKIDFPYPSTRHKYTLPQAQVVTDQFDRQEVLGRAYVNYI
jgi:hypothetical protein